ncbi:M24 family metallopeptidase [Yoonia sediminilitoris]|uniref:Xaa-Pro aminopeptidase n=1 Tax=Yoonia sediminilitoris TaxID=1286148 RepID=A0A2T6KAN1_9RHOB|nr:Xaa-Pro peptidase family protein [Yoonia sediminilitoris]PUB11842.1 Xaa-Pro aminopeptidase [Yoonia sediminilitoris]RCW91919.1 Xaa-Pro aminopeptidase [Yoonia sediminilitoris]
MNGDISSGFPDGEFAARTSAAQALMAQAGLSALLLTTEPEVRYYTGFLTRFWESPTRPWFVIVPAQGKPIAVIPSIGAHLMRQTWITDIRTWQAPDYDDDGVGLLADTLRAVTPQDGKIGLADQMESHARMPLGSLRQLKGALAQRRLVSDATITRRLRMVKSEAEIAKIRFACGIADRAFARVGEIAHEGTSLAQVFRKFQMLCLDEGADWVPYLAGAADQGGYGDVISPATDRPLTKGDVLMLDTGLVWSGYFCDFDRNYSVGAPSDTLQHAHDCLIAATQAAFDMARPGAVLSDMFQAMSAVINPDGEAMDAGRLGHGLGMQLTEWPSIIADDHTPLVPGMVLTLEPSINIGGGKIIVHEENIVIQSDGAAYLSTPQTHAMRVLE